MNAHARKAGLNWRERRMDRRKHFVCSPAHAFSPINIKAKRVGIARAGTGRHHLGIRAASQCTIGNCPAGWYANS